MTRDKQDHHRCEESLVPMIAVANYFEDERRGEKCADMTQPDLEVEIQADRAKRTCQKREQIAESILVPIIPSEPLRGHDRRHQGICVVHVRPTANRHNCGREADETGNDERRPIAGQKDQFPGAITTIGFFWSPEWAWMSNGSARPSRA
jgi:hypothetical protein